MKLFIWDIYSDGTLWIVRDSAVEKVPNQNLENKHVQLR